MARTTHGSAYRGIFASDPALPLKAFLYASTFLLAVPNYGLAQELPSGGSVAAGSASIGAPSGGAMTIDQHSDRAVIGWDRFSIGAGGSVDFRQPSASSAVLNRVTGSADSRIHGRLSGNGQVHVVNPNGIFIGPNGRVDTGGGFVASTLNTSDSDFMAGRLSYSGIGASAKVSNAGRITVGQGGYAALIGGRVSNAGTITVPLGRIGLGSGEMVTLDLGGDGFLQVAVPSAQEGDADLIDMSGTLSADGGRIEVKAATARNAARNAVNLSGVAEARSVTQRGGVIYLGGGTGGTVRVTGRVSAAAVPQVTSSPRPPIRPNGGQIDVTGADITLNGAEMDASGANGGLIRIGGDFGGAGDLPRAGHVSADSATRISANAQGQGNGGRIVLWSDLVTHATAELSARGGDQGGDGGFIEVSSVDDLNFAGSADLRAPFGAWGTLLLDPTNFDVPGDISVTDLERFLNGGNVQISTSAAGSEPGNITFNADVTWTAATTMTLQAINDVIFNSNITAAIGTLIANAGNDVFITESQTVDVSRFTVNATELRVDGTLNERNGGGAVAVDRFELGVSGNWMQLGIGLSSFSATDFTLVEGGVQFLRATGGDGSAGDPYVIVDVYGLQGLGSPGNLAADFQLGGDIDATGTTRWNPISDSSEFAGFDPIGLDAADFTGSLDGAGNAIDGLFINRDSAALFDVLSGASVTDLGMTNLSITGTFDVAGLAWLTSDAVMDTVTLSGSVTGTGAERLGGIVGSMFGGNLTDSIFDGTLTMTGTSVATKSVGGLVAESFDGLVDGSRFSGTIEASGAVPTGAGLVDRAVGGVVGRNEGILEFSSSSGAILVAGQGDTSVGGIAGINDGEILGAGSSMTVQAGLTDLGLLRVGGGVGFNRGDLEFSVVSGAVSIILPDEAASQGIPIAGAMFGANSGFISGARATGPVTANIEHDIEPNANARIGGFGGDNTFTITDSEATGSVTATAINMEMDVGGFVGENSSGDLIDAARATGDVLVTSNLDASVGGFVGDNFGEITDALAEGTVSYVVPAASDAAGRANVGGFAGLNQDNESGASLERTAAHGAVSSQSGAIDADVGGHTGLNTSAAIADSYASGDVTSTGNGQHTVGGLVGRTGFGSIDSSYSRGAVSALGAGFVEAGGLIGLNEFFDDVTFDPTTSVAASFWDSDTSGQVPGTRDGYGTPMATATFQNTADFFAAAPQPEWNFDLVWAPGDDGFYPALYALSPVIFAQPDNFTVPYGQTETAGTSGSVAGGPDLYILPIASDIADVLDISDLFDALVLPTEGVGTDTFTLATITVSSNAGQDYRVVDLPATYEVTPAALTIAAPALFKTYGDDIDLDDVDVNVTGLVDGDSVDDVDLASDGAAEDAPVSGSPYTLTTDNAIGTGLENYTITYDAGSITVDPASLIIAAQDASKTYGDTVVFTGTEFETDGLLFSDAVDLVTLSSAGAAAGAGVAGSPYAIVATDASGSGLGNYDIAYVNGVLDVDPAALEIIAQDRNKTYGEEVIFAGTEFDVTGLLLSDSVDSVTLTSAGADETAAVSGSPYGIVASAPVGSGLANYDIVFTDGALTLDALGVTAVLLDQSKTYGDTFTFDGDEFDVAGLLFGDSLDSLTITSAGAAQSATVAGAPYAITGTAPVGSGLSNYDLNIQNGAFDVAPAPLTVTADDRTKTFGDEVIFDGTEFSVTGLVVPGDSVDSAALSSLGAPRSALVAGSPYEIAISGGTGNRLENYDVTYLPGQLTVDAPAPDETPRPGAGELPSGGGTDLFLVTNALSGAATISTAGEVLDEVRGIAGTLDIAAASCASNDGDVSRYLACLSDALNDFANSLDLISTDLPPGMESVAQIVQDARRSIDDTRRRAETRLATATTDAERDAIRRDAYGEARAAVDTAAAQIRNAITLVRADDPELAAIQTETIVTVAAAVERVGIELSRATDL